MSSRAREENRGVIYVLLPTLLLSGFVLRVLLSPYWTFEIDFNTFRAWGHSISSVGFSEFYKKNWCDYMPGYLYVLWLLDRVHSAFPGFPDRILFKLPANIADLGISFLIFLTLRGITDLKKAALSSLAYFFNPASISNSTLWGQVDSFHALPLLVSILVGIRGRLVISTVSACIAFMIKPQSVVIFPVIGFFMIRDLLRRRREEGLITNTIILGLETLCALIITVVIIALPFVLDDLPNGSVIGVFKEPFILIKERFDTAYNQYTYTSLNAFNLWAVIGMWKSDGIRFLGITYKRWGTVMFGFFYALVFVSFFLPEVVRRNDDSRGRIYGKPETVALTVRSISAVTLVLLALFLLVTRVHERHLLPTIVFFSLIAFRSRLYWLSYALLSLLYVINLIYAYTRYYPIGSFSSSSIEPLVPWIVFLFFIVFILVLFDFLRDSIGTYRETRGENGVWASSESPVLRVPRVGIVVFLLVVLSVGLRLYRLNIPDSYYFDEIYFAFTAEEMAKGNRAGWEMGHSAPKGFAYEWTHPPLGKELSAIGILIFGDNPFGWRFFQALFGGLGTLIMYLLGKELFESRRIGLLSAFLFTFESFFFVLSRIAMVDIFLTVFILLASLYLVRYARTRRRAFLLVSGLFCGAAMSVKWNGVYATDFLGALAFLLALYHGFRSPGQKKGSLLLLGLKTIPLMFLAFVLIPLTVYVMSYIPFFLHGNSISDFIHLQEGMYGYHKGLNATHPYSSPWWKWPLLLRPVYLYLKDYGTLEARIYAIGNPFIWWTGCAFFVLGLVEVIRKELPALTFAVLSVLAYWLPWVVSPRKLSFLYHFLPSLPFILLIIAYFLDSFWKSRYGRVLVVVYLVIASGMFVYFYPILAAVPMAGDSFSRFLWLRGWR
ncbi:MAG TPA: phospholipid carrier-dependent glycosyltransferase [Thermodesulfobacteriota bacterium]|nr:phospholipid carrier-dependent glycosyltransferase [Thermodesulfobacteriota bacterium]